MCKYRHSLIKDNFPRPPAPPKMRVVREGCCSDPPVSYFTDPPVSYFTDCGLVAIIIGLVISMIIVGLVIGIFFI